MNLLVEDGLDAEVQAQAEQICGTYLGTSDFYTSSKTQRALDRERLTDATMLIVYSLTALFGIIGISSAAVAILNSLYQRRKEFAMLRSVGLDRKGLVRLLHIEGFFLGGKPLVIGFYGVHSGISVIRAGSLYCSGTNGHQWDLQGGFQKNPQGHYCRSLKG